MRFLIYLLLIFLCSQGLIASLTWGITDYEKELAQGDFQQNRRFFDYKKAFGHHFVNALEQMPPHGKWLEWGSGFDFTIHDVFYERVLSSDFLGKVMAVGLRPTEVHYQVNPELKGIEHRLRNDSRYQPFKEVPWNSINTLEWDFVDVVTAFIGVPSYLAPEEMQAGWMKLTNLLKKNSLLFMAINMNDFLLVDKDGRDFVARGKTLKQAFEEINSFFNNLQSYGWELIHFKFPGTREPPIIAVGLKALRYKPQWPLLEIKAWNPEQKPPQRKIYFPHFSCTQALR